MRKPISTEVVCSQRHQSVEEPPCEKWPHGRVVHHGEEWAVEVIYDDGDIERTLFMDPNAEMRAISYCRSG